MLTGRAAKRYFDLHKALIEFDKLFKYDSGDDRSIVIVGATFLDTVLEHILLAFFPEDEPDVDSLFNYDQPLGTFSNKVKMVYCLGLIDKTVRDDLRLVGKIRNLFAHDLFATFESDKVASWCKQLRWHKISMMHDPPPDATLRDLYQVGVHQLFTHLHGVVGIASTSKRSIKSELQ